MVLKGRKKPRSLRRPAEYMGEGGQENWGRKDKRVSNKGSQYLLPRVTWRWFSITPHTFRDGVIPSECRYYSIERQSAALPLD